MQKIFIISFILLTSNLSIAKKICKPPIIKSENEIILVSNNGINLFFGKPILNFGEGKAIGGSTIINGGVIAYTNEKILKLWDDQINENFFLNDEFFKISFFEF